MGVCVRETGVSDDSGPPDTGPSPAAKPQNDPRVSLEPDVDRDQLREVLPGSGDRLEARVDAIVETYELLQREGGATKDDLLKVVDSDEVGYSRAGLGVGEHGKGKGDSPGTAGCRNAADQAVGVAIRRGVTPRRQREAEVKQRLLL